MSTQHRIEWDGYLPPSKAAERVLDRLAVIEAQHPAPPEHFAVWRRNGDRLGRRFLSPQIDNLRTLWGNLPCPAEDVPDGFRRSDHWVRFDAWNSATRKATDWYCAAFADCIGLWWRLDLFYTEVGDDLLAQCPLVLVHVPRHAVFVCGKQVCFEETQALIVAEFTK